MEICGVANCVDIEPSCASTPKATDESNDSSITIFNRVANTQKLQEQQASPWLSKPRRNDELQLSLTETRDTCAPKRYLSFNAEKIDKLQSVKLRSVKKYLENLDLKPTVEQWETICDFLHAQSDDEHVVVDDCVKILTLVLGTEVDLTGIVLGEVRSSLKCGIESKQTALQLKMLKIENMELRYQIQMLKQLLKEERNASCETEKEVYSSRKNIQMLLNDRRQLQAELSEVNKKQIKEKLNTNSKESQTDLGHNLIGSKDMKKLDITCRLYQLSTEKLLKFTKVVHEVLTDYKSGLPLNCGEKIENIEKKTSRQAVKIKRAASIQNITSDIGKFFVRKHADRVCRAASVCAVRANDKSSDGDKSSDSDKFDVVERLASKAKEISSTIENILFESAGSNPRQERVEWV